MRNEFGYKDELGRSDDELDPCVGLCINCRHNTSCAFIGSAEIPKLFCEEFECTGASCSEFGVGIAVVSNKPVTPTNVSVTDEQEAGEHLGLCMNCENRESCCLTIPVGGIWFCEEYR